ncbi:TPA: hypothetical protein EYO57_29275 [Candidatus Poribacteria bacterium]|nr:hypothetical protein [Candidatus Poribacteria bacterium]
MKMLESILVTSVPEGRIRVWELKVAPSKGIFRSTNWHELVIILRYRNPNLKNYGGNVMQQEINRWVDFFQVLILTRFRQTQPQAIETLTSLLIGHLFGLCNLNQLADALCIPKSGLYAHLSKWSLYQWQRLLVVVGCQQVVDTIKQIEQMSASTKSRRRITLSVDDTVEQRHGKVLAYCSWYSGRFKKTLKGQNLLAVTVRIGEEVVPLCVRLVGKQGRANTQKPQILVEMLREIIAFFKGLTSPTILSPLIRGMLPNHYARTFLS